jgi:serine/threonine protein phosphatase PrpC
MKYKYSGRTDIGLEREVNQDSFGAASPAWGSIFILADGFGHKEGGKFASQTAVDIFISNYSDEEPKDVKQFLDDTFDEINEYIYYKKVSEYDKKMLGCTAVVMIVKDDIGHIAHIGDSRAYLSQQKYLKQLTTDHSYVQALIDKGELSAEKAMLHSKRHVLIRALGSHRKAITDYLVQPISPNDQFMLCCDGVWGFVAPSKIQEILTNNEPSQATSELIDVIKRNSGSDNITLQVISFS